MPTRIDQKLCTRCGKCIERCGMYVYVRTADGAVRSKHPELCVDCTLCVSGCPERAISIFFPHAVKRKEFVSEVQNDD